MLKAISRKDLPNRRGDKSPVRAFAADTVCEFFEVAKKPGDIVEVSGWPMEEERDAIWNAARARAAIYDELFYMDREKDMRDEVRLTRSGIRVFMERKEPFKPRMRNPYPGDIPKV